MNTSSTSSNQSPVQNTPLLIMSKPYNEQRSTIASSDKLSEIKVVKVEHDDDLNKDKAILDDSVSYDSLFGSFNSKKHEDNLKCNESKPGDENFEGLNQDFGNLNLVNKIVDDVNLYNLPNHILMKIHEFMVQDLLGVDPEFSKIDKCNNKVVLEPLYKIAEKSVGSFVNDLFMRHAYFSKILMIIIRDYPIMEPTVSRVHKIREITDLMAMQVTNKAIKDHINFFKVYFKSIRHFFYRQNSPLDGAYPTAYIDVFIERATKSKYMVVPYNKEAWGKLGQNRIIFMYLQDDNLHQQIIDGLTSGKSSTSKQNILNSHIKLHDELEILSLWCAFLKLQLKSGVRLFHSSYEEKDSVFLKFLHSNYGDSIEFVTPKNCGYGLSPLHHIEKVERMSNNYDVTYLKNEAWKCWNGHFKSIDQLYTERVINSAI
ncbi:hypothetical protein CANINC_003842 [Pichia inconspicua]|uniref:Uncharacterized protein n=1 Tax=Pichia inconspicua TaxID=52247 RepID=A0A4T0WXP5_9ASCO|nr:hypothetical protein CANINC_003842 [[Candida] inconspicua]